MFVYNIKINGSKTFKIFFTIVVIIMILILGLVFFRVFQGANNSSKNNSLMGPNGVATINSQNYTNVLKAVHENIDTYVGVKIKFTGYVYRVLDLSENQFVLARDMMISSDYQSVIVGFLCESKEAKNFENETWVEVTGEITKGDYHGDIPIIKVTSIQNTNKPNEEFVYPPDESYIPTSNLL